MKEFDFEIIFKLRDGSEDTDAYLNALYENGCDDATVSTGQLGILCGRLLMHQKLLRVLFVNLQF